MIARRIPVKDDRRIISLIREELIPISNYPNHILTRYEFLHRFSKGRTYVWRTKQGRCRGFVHVNQASKMIWVDMLAVHPHYRSKGIGALLLNTAIRYGRAIRAEKANLFVDASNARAIRFYEREGFSITRFVSENQCYHMERSMNIMKARLSL